MHANWTTAVRLRIANRAILTGTRAAQLWQQVKNRIDFAGHGYANPDNTSLFPQILPLLNATSAMLEATRCDRAAMGLNRSPRAADEGKLEL
jgi:hypothetical protein